MFFYTEVLPIAVCSLMIKEGTSVVLKLDYQRTNAPSRVILYLNIFLLAMRINLSSVQCSDALEVLGEDFDSEHRFFSCSSANAQFTKTLIRQSSPRF